MILQQLRISDLQTDQIFLCRHGMLYRYSGSQLASLIRLPDGREPESDPVHRFWPNDVVELVPSGRRFAAA